LLRFLFLLISTFTLLLANNQNLEHISLQLKWKNQFQFAGYYMAKEKGFYKNISLDVNIMEYKNNINIIKKIENSPKGGIYGVGYPNVLLHKANGANIILLSAINQLSPHILITLKSSNIKSIKDFKHKRIMIDKEAIETASFLAMFASNNLSLNDLTYLKPSFNIESLIDKKTDITTAYISNEPYQLKKMGIAFDIWNPSDYGFDFYDDILFTSTKELKLHPKRVEAFKKASLAGWRYAFSHINETVDVILKKYNTQHRTKDALLYEAKELKKLAYLDSIPLGNLDKNKIKRIVDIYNILGLVKKNVDINSFIYTPSKSSILTPTEKKYLKNKKVIKLCIDPNWMPYESFKDGKYIGISADYFKLIEDKLHLPIDLIKTKTWYETLKFAKSRKCDIISLSMKTKDRLKYLNFTKPYLKTPLVIVTRNNALFIDNFKILKGKKLAITKGYAFKEILEKKYPYLELIDVKNIEDGLQKVKEGKVYAYIGSLISIGYTIQNKFLGELKISGKFLETWDMSIAVRNDDKTLLNIMEKAVETITEQEKQKIINNWIAVEYIDGINYSILFESLGVSSIIIFIIWFLYRREKEVKKELEVQNIIFDTIINTIENPMFYKDIDGVYQNANKAFAQNMLGITREQLIGKKLSELSTLIPAEDIEFYNKQDEKLYKYRKNQIYETVVKLKNGFSKDFRIQKNLFYSNNGEILGYVGFMYDITDMKEREKELKLMASIDPMTKLYNRRYFAQVGERLLKLAKREKTSLSVIMIDIDNFKKVNDTYGHKIGDDVIIAISDKIKFVSRESDVVCRFGGEEFIVLLPNTDIDGAIIIANKIRDSIQNIEIPLNNNKNIHITVSVGVSIVYIESDLNLEASIKRADDALYRAKENGKNRVESF